MKGMLIIGKPGGPDNKGGETGDVYSGGEDDSSDMSGMAEKRASRDIMRAFKGGDEDALRAGLKAFAEACGWTGSSSEEADELE